MAKISLKDTKSGYDLSSLNSNFQKLEQELQDKVLYRDNPDGEPNQLENDIDLNGYRILNTVSPIYPTDLVRLKDITDESFEPGDVIINLNGIQPFTLNEAVTRPDAEIGQIVMITDRDNALFEYAMPTTPNGMDIVDAPASNLVLNLIHDGKVVITHLGATTSGDISEQLNRATQIAKGSSPRGSIHIPTGSYNYSSTWELAENVSVSGDGRFNSFLRWSGPDNIWAIKAESGGVYNSHYRDFSVGGEEFTATHLLLDLREFRYCTFNNISAVDARVPAIMDNSWGCEFVHCAFVPRISSPSEDTSGCVAFWLDDAQVVNATRWSHCRFQFAEVGMLVKSGGRGNTVSESCIFESLNVGIQVQDKFLHNFIVRDNYFEEITEVPVKLTRTGLAGFLNGLQVRDNYMICNGSEVGVFKMVGDPGQNLSSVSVENNAVEFGSEGDEPTSGFLVYTPDGTSQCHLTYNQTHIVAPFDNTESYKRYDKNSVALETFTSNVPFELDYSEDDQGNLFTPEGNDKLVAYPRNGSLRVVGTVKSDTQVSDLVQVVATLPASAGDQVSYTTAFSPVRGKASPQLTQRVGSDLQLVGMAGGNIAHIDFTYALKGGHAMTDNKEP